MAGQATEDSAAEIRDRASSRTRNEPRTVQPITGEALWNRLVRNGYLGLVDTIALLASAGLAYSVWARPVHSQSLSLYAELVPLVGLFVAGYALMGLYPGLGLGGVETLRRMTLVTAFCFSVVAATFFALKVPHQYSRMTFGLAFLISLVAVPGARYVALTVARSWQWWAKPVVLVADHYDVNRAATALLRAKHSGYRPAGILYLSGEKSGGDVAGVPVVGSLEEAGDVIERGIRTAVLVAEVTPPTQLVDRLRRRFRHVLMMRSYADVGVERLQVRNLGGILCIEYANNLLLPQNRFLKRALDVMVAGLSLVLLSPAILAAVIATRLASRGPVFYFQSRRGLGGREFRMPKIRTMYHDAEARLARFLEQDPEAAKNWTRRFKLKDDPRVVPMVGSFLRRFSLDEAPQLVSVLIGDMSMVGPRPLPDYHLDSLSDTARQIRQEVRPGITGLWQVSGRSDASLEEQEGRDMYYIRNWTVWMDLYILGRTAGAVLSGRGAY